MNKRVFVLILSLLAVVVLISAKYYLNVKKQTLEEYNYYIKLEKKVKEIYNLKNKYNLNTQKLNSLKKYCTVTESEDKYMVKCSNLDENKFNFVQHQIFRSSFKIKKFDIQKDKNSSLNVEILK